MDIFSREIEKLQQQRQTSEQQSTNVFSQELTRQVAEQQNASRLQIPGANPIIQRHTTQVDPRAAQALQENINNARTPNRRHIGNTGKANSWVDTYNNRTAGVETQVQNTPNARRGRQMDVAFRDTGAEGYEQRASKGTAYERQLRSNVVKDQISRGLENQRPGGLQSGDRITADPTSTSRQRLYERIGGKMFGSNAKGVIDSRILRSGAVVNANGVKSPMPDIKGLRSGLSQMAIKRQLAALGGPYLQGIIQLDGILKGVYGKGLFEHQAEQRGESLDMQMDLLRRSGLIGGG